MKKQVIFLAAVFSLCLMNKANSQVVDSGTTGDCTWTLTGTTGNYSLTISGSGAMEDYSIGDSPWYSYWRNIKTLDIQQGVTTIGECAFFYCTRLTSVTIGNSVTTIGDGAFSNCKSLTSITVPNSVTSIGSYAFYYCRGLTSVIIGNSVTAIGDDAFEECSSLRSIDVDANNTHYSSVDGVLFNKLQDTLIQCPMGKAGSYTIPNSVTTIGVGAFSNCTGLTSVTIPNSVTTIGDGAFSNCKSLTSITVPNSVTSIGSYAFYYCRGLTSVIIGNSVTAIGDYAFYDCRDLTEIYVKATTPPQISWNTFEEVPTDIPVYVCGEVEDYRNAENWNYFTNILQDNDCNMAVEELAADIINIYPNPATDNIIISLREMITNAVFTLYDMQGKVLMRQQVSNEDVISVNEFAAGLYLYNISTGKGSINGKMIKE